MASPSPHPQPLVTNTPPAQFTPNQFVAELPSQWEGGGAPTGPANTQFRHELPDQQLRQSGYFPPPSWRRFAIPTDTESLSSGFPYQQRLHDVGVSPDQWYQFTNEVINAAKLSFTEDAAAWGTGVGTATASSLVLLVFAPVAGYYAGKSVHKKTVIKKVREKLAQDTELRATLLRWNDGVFRERGMQAWLEPPSENGEVLVDAPLGTSQKDIQKIAKRQAKRFTIVIMPHDPRNSTVGQCNNTSPVSLQSTAQGQGQWPQRPSPMVPAGAPNLQHNDSYGSQHSSPMLQAGAPNLQHNGSYGSQYPSPMLPGALPMKPPGVVQELPGAPLMPQTYELDGSGTTHVPE